MIPDFSFGECCDTHDICYATCSENATKDLCDRRLYACSLATCTSEGSRFKRALCRIAAACYAAALNDRFCEIYENNQRDLCTCADGSNSTAQNVSLANSQYYLFGTSFDSLCAFGSPLPDVFLTLTIHVFILLFPFFFYQPTTAGPNLPNLDNLKCPPDDDQIIDEMRNDPDASDTDTIAPGSTNPPGSAATNVQVSLLICMFASVLFASAALLL